MADYALNLPTAVVINGIDSMDILDQAITAARRFRPMSDVEVEALLAKTGNVAARGEFDLFKTTSIFDSTSANPARLGEESPRVKEMMPA